MAEAEIAQTLNQAGDRVNYDAAAKSLVAQKSVLAYILKSVLDEYANVSVKKIAEELIEGDPLVNKDETRPAHPDGKSFGTEAERLSGSNRIVGSPTEDETVLDGTVRYDIRFSTRTIEKNEEMKIMINIEYQQNDVPGYPIPRRGIYYGSRMISGQHGHMFHGQEFRKIQKVVSIWVCEDTALARSDAINEYRITENCRRGTYRETEAGYDLMRVVVMRLGAKGEQSEDDAIRLLSKLFSVKRSVENKKRMLDEEFHIDVTEEIKKEVDDMCNLSEGIYQRGLEEGKLAGIAEGKRAGIAEGKLAGIAEGKLAGIAEGKLAGIAEGKRAGIAEGERAGRLAGIAEGEQKMLFSLVRNKVLSVRAAAKQSKMPLADFKEQYKQFLEAGPEIK